MQHLEKRIRWIHNHNINNENFLIGDEGNLENGGENIKDEDDENGNTNSPSTSTNDKDQVIQIESNNQSTSDNDKNNKPQRPGLKRRITKVSQSFDIEFEHLGLTLSNGTPILQVSLIY